MSKEWRRGNNNSNSSTNSNSFDGGGSGEGHRRSNSNSNGSGGSGSGSGSDGHLFLSGVDDDEEEDDSSSDEEPGFFVRVETIMGNTFEVYAYPSDNIELLKTRIAFQEGIPQKDQNLFLCRSRVCLDNPKTLLSDLGLNEATSHSKSIRLITNVSSGMGSKGFVSRDTSPPPPSKFPSLPQLSSNSTSSFFNGMRREQDRDLCDFSSNQTLSDTTIRSSTGRRKSRQEGQRSEPLRLPKLSPEEEDDIDGVIIFKDREDRRVYVIIKKKPSEEELTLPPPPPSYPSSNLFRGTRSTSTMTSVYDFDLEYEEVGFERSIERRREQAAAAEANWILQNDLVRRREAFNGIERKDEISIELKKQVDRIRENAKTLKKMTQIRENLMLKKKVFLDSDYSNQNIHRTNIPFQDDDKSERKNHLPDINKKDYNMNFKERCNFQNKRTIERDENYSARLRSQTTLKHGTTFNRTITSSIANLNHLKGEICLEAKKTGGGTFGILPYTDMQLMKYAQLKVKVLLADQNPGDYDYLSPQRFVPNPEPKSLIPTVVLNMEKEDAELEASDVLRSNGIGGRSDKNGTNHRINLTSVEAVRYRERDSGTSTSSSDVSVLREKKNNAMTRLVSARKSDDSLKSARLRQISQTGLNKSGGVSVRSLRSAGRRPLSGSASGTNSTIQKKKKDNVRCSECRKRIGVSCRYQCRCGKMFCSTHRYAETHNCTYDYKTEGRRQLTEANPLIVASKVDKI